MKVLFLTKYYPPSEGGIERYSSLLCSGLVKLGINVEVVAFAETEKRSCTELIDGVKVHRMGSMGVVKGVPISLSMPRQVRDMIDAFDLVHLNFPNPLSELTYLAYCRHKRAVMTYHSDIYRQKILLSLYGPVIYRVLGHMSTIIATSPKYILSSPFLHRFASRCQVIPMPIDTEWLSKVSKQEVEEMRAKYGSFVLYTGRLVYYKGVSHLINAISRLNDVTLVIVGRGDLDSKLKKQVRELGLEKKVHFLGKISDEILRVMYHACTCFVLPSIARSEAFGIVLAEAMACGKPVISTELDTGTSFVNIDGETGFVVPPQDPLLMAEKIDLLFRNIELRRKMGERARERALNNFDLCRVIQQTADLYSKLLK